MKINLLKNELYELAYNVLNSDIIKGFLDFGIKAVEILNKLISGTNSLIPLLTTIGGLIGIKGSSILDFFTSFDLSSFIDKSNKARNEVDKFHDEFIKLNASESYDGLDDLIARYPTLRKEVKETAQEVAKGEKTLSDFDLAVGKSGTAWRVFGNALKSVAISAVISVVIKAIVDLANTSKRLRDQAKNLGSEFSSTQSDIESYKDKIESLKKTIDDSTSSYEETAEARKQLMNIQNDLIDKYGTEAKSIEAITTAINDQVDALDDLAAAKWTETLNAFNTSNGNWWNQAVDAVSNAFSGYASNIDRMIGELEGTEVKFALAPSAQEGYKDFIDNIQKIYGAKLSGIDTTGQMIFKVSGDLDDIYKTLLNIQSLADDYNVDDGILNNLTKKIQESKNTLDQYDDLYKQYVLYEEIFKNADYKEYFNSIRDAYKEYQEAISSGDSKAIEEAKNTFAKVINEITNNIDDSSVVEFFRNEMYPDLQQEISSWRLEVEIQANTDGIAGKVQQHTGAFNTSDEILSYNHATATEEQRVAYENLRVIADEYGMTISQLVTELERLGIVSSQLGLDFQKSLQLISKGNADALKNLTSYTKKFTKEQKQAWISITDGIEGATEAILAYENAMSAQIEPLGFEDALVQVNDLSKGLDMLDKIYLDILNKEDFDWSSILGNEDFYAVFGGLKEEYNDFIATIAKSPNDINACQQAFNNLASAYIYNSGVLDDLTDDTKDVAIAILEQMGVANAHEVVMENLAAKKEALAIKEQALAIATNSSTETLYVNTQALLTQAGASETAKNYLFYLITTTDEFNNKDLDVKSKIDRLQELANAYGQTTLATKIATDVLAMDGASEEQWQAKYDEYKAMIEEMYNKPIEIKFTGGSGVRNYKSSQSKSSAKEQKQTVNWIERKLNVLSRVLDVINKKASEVYSTFKNQNKQLDKAVENIHEQIEAQEAAKKEYERLANSVKLSADLKKLVREGTIRVDYEKYSQSTKEMIDLYQEYYDKAKDASEAIAELKLQEKDIINQRVANIVDDYDRKKSYQNSLISLREAQAGDNPTKADYTYMIKKHNHNKVDLLREKALLEKELAKLTKGTDAWRELKQQIKDIDIEVVEIENSIADLNKAYMEDLWDQFDKGMDKLAQFQDDLSNIQSFFDGDKFDGTELTDDGLVHLTTSFQGMASAQQKIENYAHAMKDLKKQLKNGAISQEFYNEKIEEFTQAQKEASLELKQYRDAIIEIAIEGIEAETEAVNELIDAKKEELQAEKDLYSYKQSIQDKQEDITTLKKRIAALSRSTNRKDIALRLDLEEELAEKEKELAEEQANHEHDIKIEALDKEKEEFNKAQDEKIKALRNDYAAQQRVIDEYLQKVQQNYDITMGQIKSACEEFSYDVTDYFKNPFDELMKQAKNAVDYLNSIDFDKTLNVKDNGLNTGATDDYTKENYGSTLPEAEKAASKVPEEKNPSKNTNDDDKKEKDKGKKIPDNAKVSKTSGYIKYGQKGENVKVLQRALKDLKYNIGSTGVDGKFGKNTLAAVKKFQKDNKLNQDGIVGPLTRAKFKAKGYKYGVHDLDESALSIINEVGQEMILRPSEGIIFPMQKHDTVLTAEQTDNLLALSKSDIRSDLLSRLNLEQGLTDAWTELGRTGSMSNVGCNCSCNSIGDINVSMNITGVTRDEINRETQKMIENIPNTMMTELRKHGVGVNGSRRR